MSWCFGAFIGLAALAAVPSTVSARDVVVVLTPHPEEIRWEFEQGFAAWHERRFGAAAAIEWRDYGGSGDAQRIVESEFKSKPGGIGIDVFFGGGPEPFLALGDQKLLIAHTPEAGLLDGVPQMASGVELYDPGRMWFGACLSSFGILQNTRVQQATGLPRVTRWEQLADPRLAGWVGAGDPRNSGTMNNMFEAFLQAYGWERGWALLTQIAGNIRAFDRLSSTTAKECALGQVAYAFCIDYYGFIQIGTAGTTNMELVLPTDFTAISPDGVAILKGAPNPTTAAHFMDFLLSEEGQLLWYLPAGSPGGPKRHSLERLVIRPSIYERHGAKSRIRLNPFELRQEFRYDARLAGRRRNIVRALFGALMIDPHPELQDAWRALIRRGLPPAELAALGRPPVTESEAMQLLKDGWGAREKSEFRQRRRIEWQNWAREKYRRLARGEPIAALNR
jgi:iron(III) transport system substrate-binding protein